MATVNESVESTDGWLRTVVWGPLTSTNVDGRWYFCGRYTDSSVQISGTWGGATVVVQGTNEVGTPADPLTLTSANDTDSLSFTGAGRRLRQILETVNQIRPLLSGGDGTTSLTVRVKLTAATQFWRAQE